MRSWRSTPLDPAAIAAGLEEAVARRDELGALGIERAARFDVATDGRSGRSPSTAASGGT